MEDNLSIDRLLELYKYHSILFRNVLKGIKAEHTHIRLNGVTNHIAWIAGNLVATRYNLANTIGLEIAQAFPEFFEGHKAIIPEIQYPDLKKIIADWNKVTPLLEKRLYELTVEQLASKSPLFIPVILDKNNLLGTLIFLIDRESYAIGQLALMRKAFGYEAMKYE